MMLCRAAAAFVCLGLCCPTLAVADETHTRSTFDGVDVTASAGFGVLDLKSNELVFDSPGAKLKASRLIWESLAPLFSGALKFNLRSGWTFDAALEIAGFGDNSNNVDFDWDQKFTKGDGPNDWTQRSESPGTRLDHYISGTVAVGYNIPVRPNLTINVNGGVKYTSVQWTAFGGSVVGTDESFRDSAQTWPANEKEITFLQRLPVAFAGLNASYTLERWTIGGSIQGGSTFEAGDVDHHWQRNLKTNDHYDSAPVLLLGGSIGYQVNESLSLSLQGSYQRIYAARGDVGGYAINNGSSDEQPVKAGELIGAGKDLIGGDFVSKSLTANVTYKF